MSEAAKRKTSKSEAPPDALRMVEILAGDANAIECFHGLKTGPQGKKQAHYVHCALGDPDFAARLLKWNLDGFDIYMTAHLLRAGVARNPLDADIEEGRGLFIDSDGTPKPDQWHLPPDFIIEREDDPEHNWWAFWIIDGADPFPADQIERYQKRIAAQYRTDNSVSDKRRIVRLPGYTRHKANEGPGKKNKAEDDTVYRLVEGAGPMTSKLQQHDKLLPEVLPRSERKKGSPRADRERCSEQFMDDALTHTSPDYKRNDGWRGTLGAFIDANVIRKDGSFLPYDEKIDKLRKWSAEGVTYDEAQFEAECEWFLDRRDEEIPERVRLGTVDMLAREGDYTGPGPTRSAQIVERPSLFKPVDVVLPSGREWNADRFRFVDRVGMRHIPPPEWLVRDFLPQGAYAILFGAPGTFKTFIALDIALSVACGLPTEPTWEVSACGPVLFAAGEGREQIRKRIAAWEKTHYHGAEVENFVLSDPVPHVAEALQPFIEGALHGYPNGYKLVVMDNVSRSMQGLNENAQEHASNFTRLVERLQHSLGATVLTLHHTGHDDKNKDRARGSSVFGADADTVIRVDRQGKGYLVSMHMTKQRDAPEWKKPKYVRLNEVHLSPEEKSLVAAPGAGGAELSNLENRSKHHPKLDPALMELLDRTVVDVLSSITTKRWTTIDLAEAVAMREEINVESSTLARRTLKRLREDNGRRANKLYDPQQKIWRWQK